MFEEIKTDEQAKHFITNRLDGPEWRGLVLAQYMLSRQQGLSIQDSIKAAANKVIDTATEIINKIQTS